MCTNQALSEIINYFTANTGIPAFHNASLLVFLTDLMWLHPVFSLNASHGELYLHKLQIKLILDIED